jgi:hypothetical protein
MNVGARGGDSGGGRRSLGRRLVSRGRSSPHRGPFAGEPRARPVRFAGDALDDRAAPIATAIYFVPSEALTNVAKYARAEHATVTVEHFADRGVVDVADDGIGGADIAKVRTCAGSRIAWPRSTGG